MADSPLEWLSLVFAACGGLLALGVLVGCHGARPIRRVAGMVVAAATVTAAMTFTTRHHTQTLLFGLCFAVALVAALRVLYEWIKTGDVGGLFARRQTHWGLCAGAMALMMLPAATATGMSMTATSTTGMSMPDMSMPGMSVAAAGPSAIGSSAMTSGTSVVLSAILSVLAIAVTLVQVRQAHQARTARGVTTASRTTARWNVLALLGQLLINVSMIAGVASLV